MDRNYVITVVDGNASASCEVFVYDVPRIDVTPAFSDGWSREGNYVISCSDSSNCTVTARVDDNNVIGPAQSIILHIPDGEHRVSVVARDALGMESTAEWSVLVDTTPPAISGFYLTGVECPNYRFSLEASDDGSGINYDESRVYVDGELCGDGCSVGDGVLVANLPKGVHTISIVVCDRAGNCARAEDTVSVIDPDICAAVEGPFITGREGNNGWYVGDVTVRIHPVEDVTVYLDGNILADYTEFPLDTDGNHVVTLIHHSEDTGTAELNVYIPVDQTPPSVSCGYDLAPYVVLAPKVSDSTSGVATVRVCDSNTCSNGDLNTGQVRVGTFTYSVFASDRAGNAAERNCVVRLDLNDYVGDINAARVYVKNPVHVSWELGTHYHGNYVVRLDSNSIPVSGTFVDLNLSAGRHTLCVAADDSSVMRCTDINVDLAPPTVHLVVPRVYRPFHVPISWSASDDFGLRSSTLYVDDHRVSNRPVGRTYLNMTIGLHRVCFAAVDVAGRVSRTCRSVRIYGVARSRPVPSSGSPVSHHSAFVPHDAMDRIFLSLIRKHVPFSASVRILSTHAYAGLSSDANRVASAASAEFGRHFVPIFARTVVRKYLVDGRVYTLVSRNVGQDVNVVYEYFSSYAPIFSSHLTGVQKGSMLATFRPTGGRYTYVVELNAVGVPMVVREVHHKKSEEHVVVKPSAPGRESKIRVEGSLAQPVAHPRAAGTGYAVLDQDYTNVFAAALFAVAIFLILLDFSLQ